MKFIARICGLDEVGVPIVVESDVFEAKDDMIAAILAEVSFKTKYRNKFAITTIMIQEWKKCKIFNPIYEKNFMPNTKNIKGLDIHWDWY